MNIKTLDIDKNLEIVSDKAIEALQSKKIFFGHKSVGNNIVAGIKDIITKSNRFANVNIQELSEDVEVANPGIYHIKNGTNNYPKSKCDNFKKLLT